MGLFSARRFSLSTYQSIRPPAWNSSLSRSLLNGFPDLLTTQPLASNFQPNEERLTRGTVGFPGYLHDYYLSDSLSYPRAYVSWEPLDEWGLNSPDNDHPPIGKLGDVD